MSKFIFISWFMMYDVWFMIYDLWFEEIRQQNEKIIKRFDLNWIELNLIEAMYYNQFNNRLSDCLAIYETMHTLWNIYSIK
jgi:hypothetical protein